MTLFAPARAVALALGLSLIGAQAFADTGATASEPATVKAPARFETYKREGLPAPYAGKTNPLVPTIAVVLKGADIYSVRCATCHGPMGFGNGPSSSKLHPHPADLAWALSSPYTKDDYLFWTISEGGAKFGSNMPAFKKPDLTDEQIWQIITYIRAAFEGREVQLAPAGGTRQASLGVSHKTE